jgi:hypothetical protein
VYQRALLAGLLSLSLAACGAKEVLQAKNAAVPAGVDLTGMWHLREDSKGVSLFADDRAGIELASKGRGRRSDDILVNVFVETGNSLKVTQTDFALFVVFDRAVVEEYRFGELRDASVGPVSAQRASGWDGVSYIIETLDSDGVKLTERYRLVNSGQVLERSVRISKGTQLKVDAVQLFDRY